MKKRRGNIKRRRQKIQEMRERENTRTTTNRNGSPAGSRGLPFTFAALIIGSFESVLAYPSNFAGAVMVLAAGKMVRPALRSEARSGLWGAIRSFGSNASKPKPNRAPVPAMGFRAPAPAPTWDRRTASQPAGFSSLRQMGPQIRMAKKSKKGFGRKPQGLSVAEISNRISRSPPMPKKT